MKELIDILEVIQNNDEQVLLQVKKECEQLDLIMNGFDGDEILFKLTKGQDHIYATWTNKNTNYSCCFGLHGCTVISADWEIKRKKIVDFIKNVLKIKID